MRVVVLLALLPLAAAQGGPYDPLDLAWTAHLAAQGTLVTDPPEAGALSFPASDPATPALPLAFTAPAPVSFRFAGGAEARFVVMAQAPLVARNGEGQSLEIALLADGAPAAFARAALPPVMAPGERAAVVAALVPAEAFVPKGATLALHVTALMPAVPADGLQLLVGPNATLAFGSLRVPSVTDLELGNAPLAEFALPDVHPIPSGSVAQDVLVTHAGLAFASTAEAQGRPVVLLLRGVEDAETARAQHGHVDRERRLAAAHEVLVGGTAVRVHPGVGVAVPIGAGPGPVLVACGRNCGGGGGVVTFGANDATPPVIVTNDGSVLIPPPRPTTGIPVSGDAPEEKATPWGPLALAALGLAALRARPR